MKPLNPRVLTVAIGCVLAVGMTPARAFAQNTLNAFVHVGFGIKAPAEKNYVQEFEEGATHEIDTYQSKVKPIFNVGGGVMFTPMVGAMVSFSSYSDSETAHTRLVFSDIGFDDAVDTDELEHKEKDLHLDVCFVPQMTGPVDLMIFGGLSHFSVTQELIDTYSFNFFDNTIVADSFEFSTEKESAWGFNVGASVSKPINDMIGVGGMVRFSRGTVKLKDMLQADFNGNDDETISMKVGGFEASAGIIIRIK